MPYQPKTLDISQIEARPLLNDITIVIPTLGRPILEESLYWIVAGSAWPGSLIVVDQGSSQQVAAWLERLQSLGINAEYVSSSQCGKAAALNRGIERTRTRFVAVTDDDCFVAPNWLRNMAARLHETPEAVITGPADGEGSEAVVAVVTSRTPAIYHRPQLKFDAFCGSNLGVTIAVVERVGLFDEDPCLLAAEDCEWSYRALCSGVPIIYAPEIVVWHIGWRDVGQRAIRYQAYARSHGGFYGKYLRRGDWFIALRAVTHLLRALRRWLGGLISGDEELALIGRTYITGLLPGIIAGWRSGSRS
jgi:GT2 family glycosyltransferase